MNVKIEHSGKGMSSYTGVRKFKEESGKIRVYQKGGFHTELTDLVTSLKVFEEQDVSICLGGCDPVFRGHLPQCPECGAEVRKTVLE